jgi:ribulose-phosphate 3-epimerase
VHLMISDPDKYAQDFIRAGADYLTVHVEAVKHLHRTVQAIRERGVRAGVSLNPATPLCGLDYILGDIDLVLLMSVNPGFGGQEFIPSAMDKIKALRALINERGLPALISVDGGVKADNAAAVAAAGADVLVMGSAFFGSGNYAELVRSVRARL